MVERRSACRILVGKPEVRNHLKNTGVEGRVILRWISRKWVAGVGTGSSWMRIGTVGEHL